jgi:hypothetical protein
VVARPEKLQEGGAKFSAAGHAASVLVSRSSGRGWSFSRFIIKGL